MTSQSTFMETTLQIENNLTRKERQRLARQDEILNAARQVFSQRGFKNATLDEIAVIAEFGKGTIYNYFKSKEELFVSVIVRGIHRFQQFVDEAVRTKGTTKEKLEAYIDATFTFFEQNRQIFSILELERNSLARSLNDEMFNKLCTEEAQLHDYLAKLLTDGIKKGVFKKFNVQKLAQSLFGLIHTTFTHAIREPESYDFKTDTKLIKQIFFEGIALE